MHDGLDSYLTTFTGQQFYLTAQVAEAYEPFEPIVIQDIAHALALACRFGGHCREPYSVAQHSCLVADSVPDYRGARVKLAALLHDAHEAYLGDLVGPVKELPTMRGYLDLCEEIQRRIERALGVPALTTDEAMLIDDLDKRACRTEVSLLMPPEAVEREEWVKGPQLSWDGEIWGWGFSEREFLYRYKQLKGELSLCSR